MIKLAGYKTKLDLPRVATLLLNSAPDILFRWRQHLRAGRGEETGGVGFQEQLTASLLEVLGEACIAIATGRFDIDKCAESARQYGQIRFQQCPNPALLSTGAAPVELLREFRLLRKCLWEEIGEALTAEEMLAAQTRADMVFDEASAAALGALLEKLRVQESEYDPLTQLYSRALFQRELEIELQRSSRFRHRFALIMVSLNISLPPQANTMEAHDCVIIDLATMLKKRLRRTDRMFRYDENQFALICPETDATGTTILGQRIALDIAQYRQRTGLDIDAQCGSAAYPMDAQNSLSLIRVALADQYFRQVGIEC